MRHGGRTNGPDGETRLLQGFGPGYSGIGTTLSANAMALKAMRANLEQVMTEAAYAHMLPLSERMRLYLNFEAFNVTNTIVDTGLFSQAFSERGGVLSPTPSLGQGNASTGFPDGTNARRAQVSARFVF